MSLFLRFYGLTTGVTNSNFRKMVAETARDAYSVFSKGVFEAIPDVDKTILKKRINMAVTNAASFIINGWLVKSLEDISDSMIEEDYLIDYIVQMIEKGLID